MKRFVFSLALGMCTTVHCQAATDAGLIRLATLEWPPYNGQLLPHGGLSGYITSVVAKAAGYRLLTTSFEWGTTVRKGKQDPFFDGYFPEYYSKERALACYLSQSIGNSVLGLATLRTAPIYWTAITDLAPYRLGVVDGYLNGEVLDQAIQDRRQAVETGASDAVNIQKLRTGKLRGIVVDKNVFRYTLQHAGGSGTMVLNTRPIAQLSLHVCFRRTATGLLMRNTFDTALQQQNLVQLENTYFKMFPALR
ncbi:transporter substrate-binding domain-containing protein [Rhodoferax sp.]|uniref:substrate-binding periplasmic protein n=1 Tax=Rhodoferax sp. TaxID=50421 RepID=UPI0025DE3B21|nr:transporter substrate-binding domain-containing protein [Rhodoferax sp.]